MKHNRNGIQILKHDTCRNKRQLSEATALERARELHEKDGAIMVPYFCHKCWSFHVGHDVAKTLTNN